MCVGGRGGGGEEGERGGGRGGGTHVGRDEFGEGEMCVNCE